MGANAFGQKADDLLRQLKRDLLPMALPLLRAVIEESGLPYNTSKLYILPQVPIRG
jgi:hypothetical protein